MKEFVMQETEEMTTFGSVWKRYEPVVELVRCKDCVWFDGFCCQNINNKRMTGMEIDDFEWFCANGERSVK